MSEKWVQACREIYVNGKLLYYNTKPLPGGDMTYGVYTDYECSVESKVKWSGVLASYADNGNNANNFPSMEDIDRWNDLLSEYKICQPCRAYNKVQIDSPERYGDEDFEDGDDGEGGKDPWGYNCYDDAGYQNCHQCYKFASHTRMEEASSEDLELATQQGTILSIKVDGISYGKGQYNISSKGAPAAAAAGKVFKILLSMVLIVVFALLLTASARRARLRKRRRAKLRGRRGRKKKKNVDNPSLEESMLDTDRQRSKSRSSRRERSMSKSAKKELSRSQSRSGRKLEMI
jgi:hypothetical protein